MMDLSGVISSLTSGTYSVTRRSRSTYTDGRLDANDVDILEITACVQPVRGREALYLPEGTDISEALWVWTETPLLVTGSNQDPDLVTIGGQDYEVSKVENWNALGTYFRALVVLV